MNPLTNGAVNGPMKADIVYMAMATPRWVLLNRSDKLAGTSANGLAAKNPEKNRVSISVWVSSAAALARQNILNPNIPMSSGGRRPYSSEPGAHTVGPAENPSTKSVVPKYPTCFPKPNRSPAPVAAGANVALAYAAIRAQKVKMEPIKILIESAALGNGAKADYLLGMGQFWGCIGSSEPSNSTT